jgi:phosphoglycerate dehydrogenase-like enzyme
LERVKIVVWDNIGNTVLGMRPWSAWSRDVQERLLIEDPNARDQVVSWQDLLRAYDVELVWLFDPVKSQRGFRSLFDEYRAHLRPVSSPDDLAGALDDADFFILHKERLPGMALERAAKLKLIQHLGLDDRGVPMDTARERGIPVAATPLINYSAVAEHVWAMILAHYKRLEDQRNYMQSRAYLNEWGAYHPGVKIMSDLTLGLLGMGEIARPIARVARAFDMRILYWDIERFPHLEDRYGMEFVDWDTLYAQSDAVSVQLALNEQTEGIIGAKEFELMKPDALFINTARGKLVDEPALVTALETRAIGGAALDVYAVEPLPDGSPLHALHESAAHNVILTPHSAAQGPWTWIWDSQELWFNIERVLRGEPAHHLVS